MKRTALYFCYCLGLLSATAVNAQAWDTVNLDTFTVRPDGYIYVSPLGEYGMAYCPYEPSQKSTDFWIQCDAFYQGPPENSEAFVVFGIADEKNRSTPSRLWAAGYSLAKQGILFGEIYIHDQSDSIRFQLLTQKPVEINNYQSKNVFRIIFRKEKGQIQVEVNGVPMVVSAPFDTGMLAFTGYMVRNSSVIFEPLRFNIQK
jgi:hypothetical protein